MSRRLVSLLALLLLVLASQAVAGHKDHEGDKGDEDAEDDEGGGDGGSGSRQGKADDDRRDRRGEDAEDGEGEQDDEQDNDGNDERDGEEGEEEEEGDRRDRKSGRGKGRDQDRERPSPGDRDDADPGSPPTGPTAPSAVGPLDTGVEILPTALPGRVQFSFLITSAGSAGAAEGVRFEAMLPDTGSAWSLSGPSVEGCRLEGPGQRAVDCSFPGLAPGDVRLVQATSPVGRAPPWELVAEGMVLAPGDEVAGNDQARAGLGLLLA